MTTQRAIQIINHLAYQDVADDVDDSYARTGDAVDAIRRWRDSAADAGDDELIDGIETLGIPRAAGAYDQERVRIADRRMAR
jgi:hypothetical protein